MNYYISKKTSGVSPGIIGTVLKYASDPSVISMAAGSPSPEALPVQAIRAIMDEIMADDIQKALVYSLSEGFPPLREKLKVYLREDGRFSDNDDLFIVSGSQQSIDLACRVLCEEGDVIICEEPSFIGALTCFRSYGVNIAGVPIREDGIDLDLLEKALKENDRVRFIYLIPNFQNPTGYTMSLEKRRACYELAKRYNVLILEDDPYGDLRFEGEALPSIKSMDKDGIVLYARTFSKILSAGIRVGYFTLPKPLMSSMMVAKQSADVHSGMVSQLLCYRFITEYDINAHLKAIGAIYGRKCRLMLNELGKLPADKISFSKPKGGLFVWATLLDGQDGGDFSLNLVKEKKVAVVPGSSFCTASGAVSPSIRMTFAAPSDEQIVRGIAALGEMLV